MSNPNRSKNFWRQLRLIQRRRERDSNQLTTDAQRTPHLLAAARVGPLAPSVREALRAVSVQARRAVAPRRDARGAHPGELVVGDGRVAIVPWNKANARVCGGRGRQKLPTTTKC